MPNPLFSNYSQDENRVTSTILAVFERLSFSTLEYIIMNLASSEGQKLLTFKNQQKGGTSILDAVISASFTYWVETKIEKGKSEYNQLKKYIEKLEREPYTYKYLLFLTPDEAEPDIIEKLNKEFRQENGITEELETKIIYWANFEFLAKYIITVLETTVTNIYQPIASEYEKGLLRELLHFLEEKSLINQGKGKVLVVPAGRQAWAEYLAYSAYICQPDRTFRPVEYLAFYRDQAVQKPVAKLLAKPVQEVNLGQIEEKKGKVADEQYALLEKLVDKLGEKVKQYDNVQVFFLEPISEAHSLDNEIKNDLTSATSGRTVAFVQGQRYVSFEKLKTAKTTTDLTH